MKDFLTSVFAISKEKFSVNVIVFPLWSSNKKSELPAKLENLGNFEIPQVLYYDLDKLENREYNLTRTFKIQLVLCLTV